MKTLIAIVVGTFISYALWVLVFHYWLGDFFAAYTTHYVHLMKYPTIHWAMIASSLSWTLLIAYVMMKSAGEKNIWSGLMTGGLLTFLVSCSVNASFHASWNLYARRALLADIIVLTAIGAIVGGVMGLIMGMGKKE